MQNIPENNRHVSEDEGRERLARRGLRKRSTGWLQGSRGDSDGPQDHDDGHQSSPDVRRPGHLRRLTHLGGSEASPSAWRLKADRTGSISAQKWRQIKAGLRLMGQRKKEERTIDHMKSAELMAELLAGAPAALFLASMFQRDEHGERKMPVLLEQLKLTVEDSQEVETKTNPDRLLVFRIALEYGSGFTRMRWVIHRSLRDLLLLHARYKIHVGTDKYIRFGPEGSKRAKLPKFPKSSFPYARGLRGLLDKLEDDDEEDDEPLAGNPEANRTDGEASNPERPKARKRRSSFTLARRKSSLTDAAQLKAGDNTARNISYKERQRRRVERYLHEMIIYCMFRPDSNRLCKFFEMSALGVRLAAEGGFHGKEGTLMIKSSKATDYRKIWKPDLMKNRHRPKWFLVRQSYIVIVDSAQSMDIYDVFLFDGDFKMEKRDSRKRDETAQELAKRAKESATHPNHHQLRIENSQQKFRLLAKNGRLLEQFYDSIEFAQQASHWTKPHRFDSFAPVRQNVWAQWLVDGRDYMWNVSRAIDMAEDVIYIHDWWLSPELYLRRPPAISQKWRLDRLLQ
ncbi:hypothetical protein LTS18_010962, partial [Coniosporium uncinatum]